MKKLLVVAAAACAALVTSSAFADVYLVETNPNAAAPYDSWATAATTIEDAMGALGEGQTLHIGDGTYALTSGFTVNAGKVVISENGPDKTIFLASAKLTSAMSVTGAGSLLAGVTIKNVKFGGGGSNWDGMTLSSGGTISNCVFLANAHRDGQGALNQTGGLSVDCTFRNTSCSGGGSIAAAAAVSGGVMERCRVFDATSSMRSYGAIYVSGSGIVRHTVVARSSTPGCGGIRIDGGTVSNCTVVANETTTKDGDAGIYIGKTAAKVVNTICVGNYDKYGTIRPVNGVAGFEACLVNCFTDETADPRFQAPHDDDYSLLPDSPCIDADGTACGAYPFVLPTGNGAALFRELVGDWRFDPQTNRLSAVITPEGATCDPETCYWTFDGTEPSEANHAAVGLTVTNAFGLGAATVKFRATVNGESVAVDKTDWFTVKNGYVYVDKDNPNAQAPYDTWETAAATYGAGFAELKEHMVMVIGDGNYTSVGALVPPRFSTIRSANGPDTVKFARKNGDVVRIFSLTKFGSRVEGFTFNMCSGTGGGPLDMSTSATVANCVFQNATGSNIWGPQFVMSAGKVVDCKFTNISGTAGKYASAGVAVKATESAVIDRCVFDGVTFTSSTVGDGCGAVSVSGGATVRNSLFINNYLPVYSAIYVGADGHAENCSVVRNQSRVNRADNAATSAVYAADPSASIVNVLTVANTDASGSVIANTAAVAGAEGCFTTCREADSLLDGGVKFTDPEAGDYSLQAKSDCVNMGTEFDWMDGALDLAGNARVAKGVPDIGAYEYTPSTEVGVTLSRTVLDGRQFAPQLTEFAAEVTPEDAECDPSTCYWTFDGREPTAQNHDAVGLAVTNTVGIGMVTVRFRATVNGQPVAVDEENWYRAKGEFVYLDKTSTNPEPPYEKWETAAKSLEEASASLEEGMTLLVADGTYTKTNKIVTCVLPQNATVRSVNGPRAVCFRGMSDGSVVFELTKSGSRLEGLGFTFRHTSGGPVKMSATSAVVTNCVFTDEANDLPWGPMAVLTGGTMVDCIFTNCVATTGGWGFNSFGNALSASGANTLVDRCVFAGNRWTGGVSKTKALGTVWVSGGATVRNSLFMDDKGQFCSAIYVGANGHAENCTVVGCLASQTNSVDPDVGAVYAADATASVVNVLATGNTDGEDAAADASGNADSFDHCFIGGDAKFKNAAKANYRLKGVSPCLNAGVVLPWMQGALDLDGQPRHLQRLPDIGCYEGLASGLQILVW